jgi:flagellar biosynthesis protein FliQ
MPPSLLVHHAQLALWLAVAISIPVLAVAATAGLVVAALQAASQIQDPTLAHLPRLLVVMAALAVVGPWMGHQVAAFARDVFALPQAVAVAKVR